jgi:hypothetical protein
VEEAVEEIKRNARKAPAFWSMDNPVLVGTALTIGLAAAGSGFTSMLTALSNSSQ